jgi:hypothetical protein
MAENSVAPVARGGTFFEGGTADAAGGLHLEGTVHAFPNTDPDDVVKRRNGGNVVCILVRNTHTAAVTPGQCVTWTAAKFGTETGAPIAALAGAVAGIVDDHLPAAGAAVNDLYWLIVRGQAKVTITAAIASGDISEPLFGSATTGQVNTKATPAGYDFTNVVGRALAASGAAASVVINVDVENSPA